LNFDIRQSGGTRWDKTGSGKKRYCSDRGRDRVVRGKKSSGWWGTDILGKIPGWGGGKDYRATTRWGDCAGHLTTRCVDRVLTKGGGGNEVNWWGEGRPVGIVTVTVKESNYSMAGLNYKKRRVKV